MRRSAIGESKGTAYLQRRTPWGRGALKACATLVAYCRSSSRRAGVSRTAATFRTSSRLAAAGRALVDLMTGLDGMVFFFWVAQRGCAILLLNSLLRISINGK